MTTAARPSLSIIMPWRNTPPHLVQRALASVAGQITEYEFEVIIVDDFSEFSMSSLLRREVIAPFSKRLAITFVRFSKHRGISVARNVGMALADGDYVMWLDSDDELESDCVDLMSNAAVNANAEFVVGDCHFINADGHKLRRSSSMHLNILHAEWDGSEFDPYFTSVFAIQPQIVRKHLAASVKFDSCFQWAEVTDFFLRVTLELGKAQPSHVAMPLYRYHRTTVHNHSQKRHQLELFRRKALMKHAKQRLGVQYELAYLGKEYRSGARHYAPLIRGIPRVPPYLDADPISRSVKFTHQYARLF